MAMVESAPEQQAEVRRRPTGRDLLCIERRRLERIRLLGRGLSLPQVAGLVECNPVTMREEESQPTVGRTASGRSGSGPGSRKGDHHDGATLSPVS